MKKILYAAYCIVLLAGTIHAGEETKKTELVLRDHKYRAQSYATYHRLKSKKDCKSKFQVMPFYNSTTDAKKLGEVFGGNCKNCVTIGAPGSADVDRNLLLHYHSDHTNNTFGGTLKFEPRRTSVGTIVTASMKLNQFLEGLYFHESITLVRVKHDLGAVVGDSITGAFASEAHTLVDLLSGNDLVRLVPDGGSEQEPLRYAKICATHARTGLDNCESVLGWKFIRDKEFYAGIHVLLQTPTGDRPTGEWLWEPRLGSQHWGLGFGGKVGVKLWNEENKKVKFMWKLNFLYQFKDIERRTLGLQGLLTGDNYKDHILSHYYLLGKVGKYGLFPAANVLTQEVYVNPGLQLDTFAILNFTWNNFVLDFGYNIFWKDEEHVSLHECWDEKSYAIADFDWATCSVSPFALSDGALPAGKVIKRCHLDTCVAQTPSILSHTIFIGVGYVFKDCRNPVMLGVGGSYEFGGDRAAADSYMIWAKVGVAV